MDNNNSNFSYYSGRIIGSVIALIIGLLIVIFGFLNTLFLFILVVVGFLIGYCIDKKINLNELWEMLTK